MRATSLAILFTALLLWPGSVSGFSILAPTQDCSFHRNTSYFRNLRLQEQSLRLFPVKETAKYCGGEWHLHNSCCISEVMVRNANLDKSSITEAYESVVNNFKAIHEAVHKLQFMARQEAAMPIANATKEIAALRDQANETLKFADVQEFFADLAGMDLDGFERFNKTTRSCWDAMIRHRSAAICSSCSGRAKAFFQGDKAIVSGEFCTSLVSECHESLDTLVKIVSGLRLFREASRKFEQLGIKIDLAENFGQKKSHNYWSCLKNSSIPQLFARYSLKKGEKDALEICSKFLHLGERTFIEFIRDLFNPVQTQAKVAFSNPVLSQHIQQNEHSINSVISRWFGAEAVQGGLIAGLVTAPLKITQEILTAPLKIAGGLLSPFNTLNKAPKTSSNDAPPKSNFQQPLSNLAWKRPKQTTAGNQKPLASKHSSRILQNFASTNNPDFPSSTQAPSPFNDPSTPPNFVQGDTQVQQNTDSAYSSHLGAQGANGMHQHGQPMNMTNRFP